MKNSCFNFVLLSSVFVSIVYSLDCEIPEGCRTGVESAIFNTNIDENVYVKSPTVWCDFNDDSKEFEFKEK